jgi:hypothetical protein
MDNNELKITNEEYEAAEGIVKEYAGGDFWIGFIGAAGIGLIIFASVEAYKHLIKPGITKLKNRKSYAVFGEKSADEPIDVEIVENPDETE